MAKMSREQKNYMMALAHYEALQEQYAKEVAALDDSDIDAYIEKEQEICDRLGMDAAFQMLDKAEQELVEWCFRVIENHPLYKANLKDLEQLRGMWKKNIGIRKKIAKLALKLSA